MPESSESTPSVGRPRRFDDATERRMLVDSATRLMDGGGVGAVSVEDVLDEAGLSTRAFYRHFESKEALIETLMLREAESVGRSLARVMARSTDPPAAVAAWIDRFLAVFLEPRRARRAQVLAEAAEGASRLSMRLMAEMRQISCAPLIEALRSGHQAGVLHSPWPEADAYCLFNLVTAVVAAAGPDEQDATRARATVVRYAWPALGVPSEVPDGGPSGRA